MFDEQLRILRFTLTMICTSLCVQTGLYATDTTIADLQQQAAEDATHDKIRVIFDGKSPNRLACDTTLRKLPDGSWAMIMLGGGDSEPRPENQVWITRSTDEGETWSEIKPLDLGIKRENPNTAMVPSELMILGDRCTMIVSTHDGKFANWKTWFTHSTDNCETWGPLEPAPGPLKDRTFIRNHIVTRDGRIMLPFQHYVGSPSCRDPRNGVIVSEDNGKSWTVHGWIRQSNDYDYKCWAEPNIVELADGTITMLTRATSGWLHRAESKDGGRTWPEMSENTDVPNPSAKITLYSLGGNAVAMLHNPNFRHRSPLSLWISFDGTKSWPYQRVLISESADKNGSLNYPDGFISDDKQFIHFAFDDNRRRAVYVRAKLPGSDAVQRVGQDLLSAGDDQ
jgi:predicted neuraminidase